MKSLEEKIKYTFKDKKILEKALTHRSYVNENRLNRIDSNERLEFLGDAVLEIIMSEYLYKMNPHMLEGDMSKKRSSMVCESALYFCGEKINLGSYILLGKGEEITGGREKSSIISDTLEAIIGGIYLDGGMEETKKFVSEFIIEEQKGEVLFDDYKTALQEIMQEENKYSVSYKVLGESGPAHKKLFQVECFISDKLKGVAFGSTKKEAEQLSAKEVIKKYMEKGKA